jgi:hypothetical protein
MLPLVAHAAGLSGGTLSTQISFRIPDFYALGAPHAGLADQPTGPLTSTAVRVQCSRSMFLCPDAHQMGKQGSKNWGGHMRVPLGTPHVSMSPATRTVMGVMLLGICVYLLVLPPVLLVESVRHQLRERSEVASKLGIRVEELDSIEHWCYYYPECKQPATREITRSYAVDHGSGAGFGLGAGHPYSFWLCDEHRPPHSFKHHRKEGGGPPSVPGAIVAGSLVFCVTVLPLFFLLPFLVARSAFRCASGAAKWSNGLSWFVALAGIWCWFVLIGRTVCWLR